MPCMPHRRNTPISGQVADQLAHIYQSAGEITPSRYVVDLRTLKNQGPEHAKNVHTKSGRISDQAYTFAVPKHVAQTLHTFPSSRIRGRFPAIEKIYALCATLLT